MPRRTLSPTLILALLVAACAAPDDYAERMSREHEGDTPIASPGAQGSPETEITSSEVVYADLDGTEVSGYLARPVGMQAGPGVLVIQEWWGLNDNIRSMADQLAGAGYVALAVDLYEGEVAEDRGGARALVQKAMAAGERLEKNMRQARAYLVDTAGATRVGTIGWCFGGGWSLRTALVLGDGVDAAVMYYGRVVTEPERLAALSAPLLGHFGELDNGIPVDGVRQMEAALGELGKAATVHVYEGANHAFANPSGTRYQQAAADLAWERTLEFFAAHLN